MYFIEKLLRQPAWIVVVEGLGLVGLIGWIDHVTGSEWSCFAPYAVPIVLVTWKAGRRLGFMMAALCALTYWAADRLDNPYQTQTGFLLAVFVWWFYFSVLVVAVGALKGKSKSDQLRIQAHEYSQSLELQILNASEAEQQRIGLDLHDNLGPHLAAISYAATFLANDLRRGGLPEAAQADKINAMASDAVILARDLARGIFSLPMEGAGLAIALEDLARTTIGRNKLSVTFHETGNPRITDPQAGLHLYRIAQEAVNNAAKHSGARKITIALDMIDDYFRLTIADDGMGMAPAPNGSRGMGLHTMRYRAQSLGGELKIESRPGKGTIISCQIPNRSFQYTMPSI